MYRRDELRTRSTHAADPVDGFLDVLTEWASAFDELPEPSAPWRSPARPCSQLRAKDSSIQPTSHARRTTRREHSQRHLLDVAQPECQCVTGAGARCREALRSGLVPGRIPDRRDLLQRGRPRLSSPIGSTDPGNNHCGPDWRYSRGWVGQRDALDSHRRPFDVAETHPMGLVQELVPVGEQFQHAMQIASQAEVDPLPGRQPDGRRSVNA